MPTTDEVLADTGDAPDTGQTAAADGGLTLLPMTPPPALRRCLRRLVTFRGDRRMPDLIADPVRQGDTAVLRLFVQVECGTIAAAAPPTVAMRAFGSTVILPVDVATAYTAGDTQGMEIDYLWETAAVPPCYYEATVVLQYRSSAVGTAVLTSTTVIGITVLPRATDPP